jgi:hypothetical protein
LPRTSAEIYTLQKKIPMDLFKGPESKIKYYEKGITIPEMGLQESEQRKTF